MRIVQLLPELNEGGVERGVVELNREFVKCGHESIVISAGGKLAGQIASDGGRHITFDVCSKNPLTVLRRVVTLRRLFRELRPDVLHARSRVPAWLAYLANRNLGIAFVTTVHGFNSVSLYSRIMTMGDRVICVSSAVKNYIMKHYRTEESKITVIPRGVDLEKFNPEKLDDIFMAEFISRFGLEGKTVVASVGRITQLKDYETFIRAIALLKGSNPGIVGLIVGGVREDKARYAQSLHDLAMELGVGDAVIFTGSQSKIAEIYRLSEVVVSASKKPESFGRSLAEAIAVGTPVVATNHGGVKDIIDDGVNGAFFETGDAEGLAEQIRRVSAYRFDGYRYISERFSLSNMLEQTLKIYKEVTE